ncbi:TPA: alanine racemase [Enterococcus faecium]|uniref:alanine racemase n=2 Tax=Enterococcus faecium TaxID=1352 RepID=UPI00214DC7ED|nr:alanine racemase [Enterococcus faecium]
MNKIMTVVKANAYGHGAIKVSRVLQGEVVRFFSVSNIEEAIELRKDGINETILILGYTPIKLNL